VLWVVCLYVWYLCDCGSGVRGGFDGEMLGYVCVCFSLCGVVYGLGLIVYYCD
jgi:hypothetical protein